MGKIDTSGLDKVKVSKDFLDQLDIVLEGEQNPNLEEGDVQAKETLDWMIAQESDELRDLWLTLLWRGDPTGEEDVPFPTVAEAISPLLYS